MGILNAEHAAYRGLLGKQATVSDKISQVNTLVAALDDALITQDEHNGCSNTPEETAVHDLLNILMSTIHHLKEADADFTNAFYDALREDADHAD